MPACISSLDSNALTLRLAELAGEEREIQVDFLLHLAEFDARRAYVEAGYSSLWSYCLEVLHLREGAAGRRIGAMRVLVRLPRLEAALRDGRLSLSTLIVLGPVLTEENAYALLARAAFRTKREVEELVVSLRPRAAPTPGLRKVPARAPAAEPAPLALTVRAAAPASAGLPAEGREGTSQMIAGTAETCPPPTPSLERRRPAELEPVAQERWSLRATVDRAFKDDLETLRSLLARKVPDGDLTKVLHEAVRCAVEKQNWMKRPLRTRGGGGVQGWLPRKSRRSSCRRALTRSAPPRVRRRKEWGREEGRP